MTSLGEVAPQELGHSRWVQIRGPRKIGSFARGSKCIFRIWFSVQFQEIWQISADLLRLVPEENCKNPIQFHQNCIKMDWKKAVFCEKMFWRSTSGECFLVCIFFPLYGFHGTAYPRLEKIAKKFSRKLTKSNWNFEVGAVQWNVTFSISVLFSQGTHVKL